MAFDINNFRSNGLPLGGARPSLFQIFLTPPVSGINTSAVANQLSLTCTAASVPPASLGVVEVPYFGRKIKLAGDRVFPDWTVTVMNDEDFQIRDTMEKWSNDINQLNQNLKTYQGNGYKSAVDTVVSQYSKSGAIIKQYSFVGLWPSEVSTMDLNWDSVNTIQSFNVTFSYDYWYPYYSGQAPASGINIIP